MVEIEIERWPRGWACMAEKESDMTGKVFRWVIDLLKGNWVCVGVVGVAFSAAGTVPFCVEYSVVIVKCVVVKSVAISTVSGSFLLFIYLKL